MSEGIAEVVPEAPAVGVQRHCSAFRVRVTRLSVIPVGEPVYSERGTHISVVDEAAGEFLEIEQMGDGCSPGTIRIEDKEWPTLREAIDTLMAEITKQNASDQPASTKL